MVIAIVAGCSAEPAAFPIPTETEAASLLTRIWAVVAARDLTRLCDYGTGPCEKAVRDLDPATLPTTPPTITGSWVLPTRKATGNAWWVGGRVLELCGIDGLGRPYSSEMLVFRDSGHLLAVLPVFWTGMRIATDGTIGVAIPGQSAPPCPSGPPPPTLEP